MNSIIGNINSVNEQELLPLMEDGNRLTIFILGENSSIPKQSNPIQYPINKNGNTLIVIPEHWYGFDYLTLSLYLLHETGHAGFFFAGKIDTVHTVPAKYGSIVDGNRVYYKDLIKELKGVLDYTVITTTTPILRLGSNGSLVKELQQILREKGFFTYPNNTGYFGLLTRSAVIAFQKSKNLVSDGIVGSKTWAMLKKKL